MDSRFGIFYAIISKITSLVNKCSHKHVQILIRAQFLLELRLKKAIENHTDTRMTKATKNLMIQIKIDVFSIASFYLSCFTCHIKICYWNHSSQFTKKGLKSYQATANDYDLEMFIVLAIGEGFWKLPWHFARTTFGERVKCPFYYATNNSVVRRGLSRFTDL